MTNKPIQAVSEVTRDEYLAIAKPFRGLWRRLIFASIIGGAPATLFPVLVFIIFMVGISSNPSGGAILRPGMIATFLKMSPIFIALQGLYLVIGVVNISRILGRSRSKVRRLFPDLRRRETLTTWVTSYGVVQSSAGISTIIPWGNVVRIDEIAEAFVLESRNLQSVRWAADFDLVYILKPKETVLSMQLLEEIRSTSVLLPSYRWHPGLTGARDVVATNTVWPPPPVALEPEVGLGVPLSGTIYLPMLEVFTSGSDVAFKSGNAARARRIPAALIMPFVFLFDSRAYFIGSGIYWGIAGALGVGALFCVLVWRSSQMIGIDGKRSVVMLGRRRFAQISEIDSITVVDQQITVLFGAARKRAFITIRTMDGKSKRLLMTESSGAPETNVFAMILGHYLMANTATS